MPILETKLVKIRSPFVKFFYDFKECLKQCVKRSEAVALKCRFHLKSREKIIQDFIMRGMPVPVAYGVSFNQTNFNYF